MNPEEIVEVTRYEPRTVHRGTLAKRGAYSVYAYTQCGRDFPDAWQAGWVERDRPRCKQCFKEVPAES